MQRNFKSCLLMLSIATMTVPVGAQVQSRATAPEAISLVKQAVSTLKLAGNKRDAIYSAVTAKDPKWVDRDLYLVVYGLDGVVKAHGANAKLVGNNLIDLLDIDGKAYIKERMDWAKAKGSFWQDYKYTNPVSKKIEPKSMYCERLEDVVACAGVYKS